MWLRLRDTASLSWINLVFWRILCWVPRGFGFISRAQTCCTSLALWDKPDPGISAPADFQNGHQTISAYGSILGWGQGSELSRAALACYLGGSGHAEARSLHAGDLRAPSLNSYGNETTRKAPYRLGKTRWMTGVFLCCPWASFPGCRGYPPRGMVPNHRGPRNRRL